MAEKSKPKVVGFDKYNFKNVKAQAIKEFNERYSICMYGSKCRIIEEVRNNATDRPDIRVLDAKDFNTFNAHKIGMKTDESGNVKPVKLSKIWLESPLANRYKDVVFAPGREIDGCYNLWRGFAVRPKKGDWELMQDHILLNLCSGSMDLFEWVLQWLSRIFQDPGGDLPGSALVLRGEKGTGKGIFANSIGHLLGNHYWQTASRDQVTGQFNSHLKNIILLFCDEGFFAGNKSDEGVLKNMITEPLRSIEQKFNDSIMVKNFLNLIIASNNDWVIPASIDERRYLVLQVSSEKKQNISYFKKILKQMNSGGYAAMLYDFLRTEIDYDSLRNPPKTEALIEQIFKGADTVLKFWAYKLDQGTLNLGVDNWEIHEESIERDKLYKQYLSFCDDVLNHKHSKEDSREFGKKLRKYAQVSDCRLTIQSKRERCYRFPELAICKQSLADIIGFDLTEYWGRIDESD